jgi:hypothetical protein
MMNNLLTAIIAVVLVGTFLMAPAPQPAPQSIASRPAAEPAAASSVVDSSAAKAAIEAYGYREVSVPAKAADGVWRAKAYIGTAEVRLTVDAAGKVLPE